jgi:hypothetical protein
MHPISMNKMVLGLIFGALVSGSVSLANLTAQPSQAKAGEEGTYGDKFFDQLRTIFGMFRDADLERVFQAAHQIQCSELIGQTGQWRPVAFFNEDRSLGDWCHNNLQEVKSDLSVYSFKGDCGGKTESVRVGTEFPTAAGFESYRQKSIELRQVDVIVNDPVNVALNRRTKAYTFDLPYLFLNPIETRGAYSFIPPDRDASYAKGVTSRWECKTVSSKDVTYRFLICRVSTIPQVGSISRNQGWVPSFGSSAFFILSDGMEAKSSVNFTFGDEKQENAPVSR